MNEQDILINKILELECTENSRIEMAAKLLGMNPYELSRRVGEAIDTYPAK